MRLHLTRVARTTAARAAAVFLLLAGIAWLTMQVMVLRIGRDFDRRSSLHLGHEVQRIRRDVAHTESKLDAAVDRVSARLNANPSASREAMFAMLRGETYSARQGIRIIAPNGDAIAWWGEDLRTPGTTSYEFDATNLYIVRSRPLPNPAVSVQAFERVPNQPKGPGLFDLDDDDWVNGTMFHAGVLRQEHGSLRFIVERRPSATLWIDVTPRAKADIIDAARAIGNDVASILLALAALVVLWGVWSGKWEVEAQPTTITDYRQPNAPSSPSSSSSPPALPCCRCASMRIRGRSSSSIFSPRACSGRSAGHRSICSSAPRPSWPSSWR